jgi:ElaB/YqjD/DUF883 family membrane-anchored ribosome-binding protein
MADSRTPGNIQGQGEAMASAASQMAGEAKDRAREALSGATQKAQDLMHKAQDTASSMGQKAQDVAASAQQRTDEALSNVGEKMSSLAGTLRQSAPREGTLGTAATAVADRLQAGGSYLQEHGVEDMAGEVTAMVRRYPMQSVLIGLGIGFLLGQAISSRR